MKLANTRPIRRSGGMRCGWAVAGVLLYTAHCTPALGTLGADVSSVESDRQHMRGQLSIASAPAGYTVHEIQMSSTTIVREYVSASGKVFAVSWRGPVLPDLRQTLGTYFDQYQSAAAVPHAGHRHLGVDQPGLVVRSNGHMRAFSGHAYIPALLPTNLSPDDIK